MREVIYGARASGAWESKFRPPYKLEMSVRGRSIYGADVTLSGSVGGRELEQIEQRGLLEPRRLVSWYLQRKDVKLVGDEPGRFITLDELLLPFLAITARLMTQAHFHSDESLKGFLTNLNDLDRLLVERPGQVGEVNYALFQAAGSGQYVQVGFSSATRLLDNEWVLTRGANQKVIWRSPNSKAVLANP